MEEWVIGKIRVDREVKSINEKLPFKTQHSNIPAFHRSIYEEEFQASKKPFILNPALAGYKFRDIELFSQNQ